MDALAALFAGIDFGTVTAWVGGTLATAVILIALLFKGIGLGKRGIKMA